MSTMFTLIRSIITFRKNKKGTPILEEILLIGIAIFIFIIIFSVILNMIDWSTESIEDLFR